MRGKVAKSNDGDEIGDVEEKRSSKKDVADVVDDDDEGEDQDEYEQDGFIVDDVEEEADEKQERDDERHRKRKKKRRDSGKNFVLDEDDYELLLDNKATVSYIPQHNSTFKRLKKGGRGNEAQERSRFSGEGEFCPGGQSAEEKLKRSLFGDDEQNFAEKEERSEDGNIFSEDDEMADFIVDEDVDKTGVNVRKKAPAILSSSLQEPHEIFGDVDELLMLRKQGLATSANDCGNVEKNLEDDFEPYILSERYMTSQDYIIRDTDIPERIQLSEDITGPPPVDDSNIEDGMTWIYERLSDDCILPLSGYDQIIKEVNKEEIGNVLRMMHVQKLDVPFISMYRKELCSSLLKVPNADMQDGEEMLKMKWHKLLWAVQTLSRKWLLLQKRKKTLHLYYNKYYHEEAQRVDEETSLAMNQQLFKSVIVALNDAKSEREVDDNDAKFNLHFPPGEVDARDGQFKRPKRKSLYTICDKAGLREIANKFGVNSETFGLFLSQQKISDELDDKNETPEEIATKYTCSMFETPQDVLRGARHMTAVEIGCEPNVKKHIRSIFMEKAVVSTSPTPDGDLAIDAYHQLAGVKWLCNKPLREFVDAQWLLIQKGEEEKLLQVSIKLPEDIQKKLLSDACDYYHSDGVNRCAQIWNEQRRMILEESFLTYIFPSMIKEAQSLLSARAKNWLLMEYGRQLWNKVSVAPFRPKDPDNDLEGASEARVMACCWGPGKPATSMVMLDSTGEMVDMLYAGSISVRSQAVADQQRKRNDHQRLIKFMTGHRPHAICVGAANMACRQLKDDISDVIYKMAENHPEDSGKDFANIPIVFGDESLPQIYENSKVASDQFSCQPGIVRRAIALGRYLQNPLAMIATLCGPGKEILTWKLCPLEHFLTSDEKYEVVEQIMIDVTNQVGLDVNIASSHEWLFAPLQFVSGLGPRKATTLQKAFVRVCPIFNRKELPMGKILRKKVFINAVGFLRVRHSGVAAASSHIMDLLDDTRIHPESYELAKKLAKDVYDKYAPDEANDMDDYMVEMTIAHVRENPHTLKTLDIDEYAKSIFNQYGANKRETLHDIKMELLQGFQDWRTPFKEQGAEDEFTMLSGESDNNIFEGTVVQVTVCHVQEDRVICTFDSGLKGILSSDDVSDEGYDPEKVHKGDILTCKIKQVNKNRFVVYLTAKASELRKIHPICNVDPYYQEYGESSQMEAQKTRKEKVFAKKHFKPRMIFNSRFQNLTAEEAMEYLSNKQPGESIMRPSSNGPSFLTLTLKVFDGIYAHKEIAERGKDLKDIRSLLGLGKALVIDKDTYGDLNEVMDRYVDPLVSHLKNMLSHHKFRIGTKMEVDGLLRAEKEANPKRIVYCFGISHDYPGTFILSYIRSSNPHHEYIGLCPKGFRFRKKDFHEIDHLVAYFQKNVDKPPLGEGPSSKGYANLDAQRSTPGFNSGDRYDSRNAGCQDDPSEFSHPGRGHGRGRGRGRGNNFSTTDHDGSKTQSGRGSGSGRGGSGYNKFGSESNNSNNDAAKWVSTDNDSSNTSRDCNSPARDPWDWGNGDNGSGQGGQKSWGNNTGEDGRSDNRWAGAGGNTSEGGREGSLGARGNADDYGSRAAVENESTGPCWGSKSSGANHTGGDQGWSNSGSNNRGGDDGSGFAERNFNKWSGANSNKSWSQGGNEDGGWSAGGNTGGGNTSWSVGGREGSLEARGNTDGRGGAVGNDSTDPCWDGKSSDANRSGGWGSGGGGGTDQGWSNSGSGCRNRGDLESGFAGGYFNKRAGASSNRSWSEGGSFGRGTRDARDNCNVSAWGGNNSGAGNMSDWCGNSHGDGHTDSWGDESSGAGLSRNKTSGSYGSGDWGTTSKCWNEGGNRGGSSWRGRGNAHGYVSRGRGRRIEGNDSTTSQGWGGSRAGGLGNRGRGADRGGNNGGRSGGSGWGSGSAVGTVENLEGAIGWSKNSGGGNSWASGGNAGSRGAEDGNDSIACGWGGNSSGGGDTGCNSSDMGGSCGGGNNSGRRSTGDWNGGNTSGLDGGNDGTYGWSEGNSSGGGGRSGWGGGCEGTDGGGNTRSGGVSGWSGCDGRAADGWN